MTQRPALPWRERALLRVTEVAGLCGDIDERSLEAHVIPHVEVRMIGRIRMVTTESFRRWLGEIPAAPKAPVEVPDREAIMWAKQVNSGRR